MNLIVNGSALSNENKTSEDFIEATYHHNFVKIGDENSGKTLGKLIS